MAYWTNSETACVHHCLTSDELILIHCKELVEASKETDVPLTHLAMLLRELVEKRNPFRDKQDIYAKLLWNGLLKVNWFEIAKRFLKE
jgi:hypothetical protein